MCSATSAAVRNSRFDSSGFWWMSWRHSMTLGSTSAKAWSRPDLASWAAAGALKPMAIAARLIRTNCMPDSWLWFFDRRMKGRVTV